MENQQERYEQFRKIISSDSDVWMEFSPKDIVSFMGFCIKLNNTSWIKRIHEMARKRLKDKGLVENGVLGWVYPEEIQKAGVNQDSILDMDKFQQYMEYKASVRESEYKQEYKERMEREQEEYFNQVIKEAEQCSPSPNTTDIAESPSERPDGTTTKP